MMRAMKQLGMTAAIIGTMSAAPVLAQETPPTPAISTRAKA
ncbi:MAG: hypothetical protein ACLSHC_05320 [Bilophila wadsworthia]